MSNTVRKNFPVQGMGCAACVARVQSTIKNLQGVSDCNVSLASNSARVDYNPKAVTPAEIKKAVQDAGYDLIVVDGDDSEDAEDEAESEAERYREDYLRSLARDMRLALILSILVMLIGMGFNDFPGKGIVLLALATPVVFWCGRRFITTAWKQLRHGSASMDTLVALSILISYMFSVFNLLFPKVWTSRGLEPHLYFESATMIVAFILIGRVLEEKAKHSTSSAIRNLAGLQPKTVRLSPGDEYTVNPGERIPADGVVVSGESFVDESMLTGEPFANHKEAGAKVFTGTMNQKGSFVMRAEKVGKDTMLSSIIKMVRDAQGSKAKIQHTVDKVAAVFVPVIIGISLITLLCWLLLGPADNGLTMGLIAMVSVLVIACPCSLGLATPTALTAGIGNCAKKGILVKDADSLQIAKEIDTIVFDKTGTLTKELPAGIIPTSDMEFEDEIKETSAEAVSELRKMGLEVYMLSGDNPERAGKVASKVGIDNVISGVFPDRKHEHIKDLQAKGKKVAMVGDGINDSPALAVADLSIAMGNGTDVAMNAAMVTIVGSDLKAVPELIKMSRRTTKIINENLFWAFFYNILAVPVAAGALYPVNGFLLNPMIAAACMALSSVCVVTNSLRLKA
ncbi:MAG: heavy metal translocating P-type ATPase [Bacteroidales bacterium]|nr:heavy metal translocating P-type ATPase [Bacteroidales bacterium]